jgi:nucleoside-diphosphate-sugar epimerase
LLREEGWEVHGTVAHGKTTATPGVRWHQVDLLDANAATALVAESRPECLLHLAWVTAPGLYWTSLDNARWVEASMALGRAFCAAGGRQIVCAGTCAEYDWSLGVCVEGVTRLAPTTTYGKAKLQLFHRMLELCADHDLAFSWGRIFHLYGPHEHPARLIPSVIIGLLGGGVARTTTGEQVRGFLHVSDVARAFARVVASDHVGAFNVGSSEPLTIGDVVRAIADLLNARDRIRLGALPTPSDDPPRLIADNTRLQELGWRPQLALKDGLAATIEWWRQQEAKAEASMP